MLLVGASEEVVVVLEKGHPAGPSSAAILQECQMLCLEGVYSGVGRAEVEEASSVSEVPASVAEVASA